MTTTERVAGRTTTDPATTAETVPVQRRISARVRILLWLLLVTAVGFAAVAMTTRSILLRDVDNRVSRLLAQETGEFAHFEDRGVDPETGRPFTDPDRLLRVFLERQYADPDEELIGLVGRPDAGPAQRFQPREIDVARPLHRDADARRRIFESPESTGTLHRASGEIRWAKVAVARSGSAPDAAFVVAFHPGREQARANEVFRILLAISCVALLMTTGIGWVVAGRILKPVRLVRTAAAQLTEQDLTRRIPVRGRDDVAALAETFNAMLDRLERAFAAQREFVDDAGHELRTPITIVRGHLELMGDDPAEREETVRLVTDELDRMSRIVEDLLLLAKAERPDFVTPEPVQLAELTADVFVKARTLGDRHWELAEVADGEARLDPQRITQAMVQLAQNAVQHTAPGQSIRIGSRLSGSRVELYVADSGPGVQAQDAELIFERFRRGTARRGARGSGAGLGLSIVRAIAEGHRGQVQLRDTEGDGATFVLVLEFVLVQEEERT
ncbi:HAMP domain-containing protein [Streptomyces sp. HC44]|uniref:histidine kinase n=1 Tax=Streptomyces scabichelini TaxID=2711217 RepID=A0A6G4VGS1_9ACTN|nr:ATP-binding protein [Streptomyces scabichelini]NGO13286.1 HAMP domain-containing protein [Streptomyces scabichelini]